MTLVESLGLVHKTHVERETTEEIGLIDQVARDLDLQPDTEQDEDSLHRTRKRTTLLMSPPVQW
jgi:hypothetical protein